MKNVKFQLFSPILNLYVYFEQANT